MSARWIFAGVALLAMLAGLALWLAGDESPRTGAPQIAPAALYAATFKDASDAPQSLGRFEGKVVVLNFWATWCAPCREEMPAFARLQARWGPRGVQFDGLANDDPARVARFARELSIDYPLLIGGADVDELARRLGDLDGVLPYTVILDPYGTILKQKAGAYTAPALEAILADAAARPASK
jgi:thiol-disulfide isomerase/thioredoxin